LHREVPTLAADYDHVVIDGPPQVADVTRSAVLASDVVLIPVQPSGLDVWGASAVVALLTEAAMVRPNLKAAFVISRKMVNTALARDVPGTLADYRLATLKTSLAQRVAFAESLGAGLTVFDLNPRSAASVEVNALTKEVMEFANGQDGNGSAAQAGAER
jgi:chromosome partitioning protein